MFVSEGCHQSCIRWRQAAYMQCQSTAMTVNGPGKITMSLLRCCALQEYPLQYWSTKMRYGRVLHLPATTNGESGEFPAPTACAVGQGKYNGDTAGLTACECLC